MSIAVAPTQYTVEEFLELPEHELYELVDGRLEEINVSNLSSAVAVKVIARLDNYVSSRKLGWVFSSESYYRCFPKKIRNARKPDVSFIAQERLPANWMEEGLFSIAPDLAVEVLSPNDKAYKVMSKTREYLEAGVKLVWEINPQERLILIHRLDGTVAKLKETDTLSGENVIPGFACPVSELFSA